LSINIKSRIDIGKDSSGNIVSSTMELKDDGEGQIYRCNTSGSIASWNKVGEVLYEDGIIVLQSPNIYNFAANHMEISFKATHVTNVSEINIPINVGKINSSSNSTFTENMRASAASHDYGDDDFVYISEVYLHDENLNVIAKAKLAQPLVKRNDDSYLLRIKLDY